MSGTIKCLLQRAIALLGVCALLLVLLPTALPAAAAYEPVLMYTAGAEEARQNADGFHFTSGDFGKAIVSKSVELDGFSVDFRLRDFTHTQDIVTWAKSMILAVGFSDTTDSIMENTKDTKAFVIRVEPVVQDGKTGIRLEGFAKTGAQGYDAVRIDGGVAPVVFFDYDAQTVMNLSIRQEDGQYQEAMACFRLGAERSLYSEAYAQARKASMRLAFPYVATGLLILAVAAPLLLRLRRRRAPAREKVRRFPSVRTMAGVLIHPIDEGEEMRWKKTGSLPLSIGLLAIWLFAAIAQEQLTGFIFNTHDTFSFNLLIVLFRTLVLFVAFVVCNWSICTLLDGEGRLRQIWVATAYALVPFVAATLLAVVASQFLVEEEQVFLTIVQVVGIGWSVFVGLLSLMVVHQYSFFKTVLSVALTLIGMVFLLFLLILLFGLIQEITSFLVTIFREILLRL